MILILSELVSGRGTGRRSRMVEGQARDRLAHDPPKHRICIFSQRIGGYSQRLDACRPKPFITSRVSLRTVPAIVRLTVKFDGESRIAAEEIEDIGIRRMLTAKLEPAGPLA